MRPKLAGRFRYLHFSKGARRVAVCMRFRAARFTRLDKINLGSLVTEQLAEYGFSEKWREVVTEMVLRVVETPLVKNRGLKLSQISNRHKLVELPFYYPLEKINAAGLSRILHRHGFVTGQALKRAVEQLSFSTVSGYMKGFIDLVFRHQDQFYLLDYKFQLAGEPD